MFGDRRLVLWLEYGWFVATKLGTSPEAEE